MIWASVSDVERLMQRDFDSDSQPTETQVGKLIDEREAEINIILHQIGVDSLGTNSQTYIIRTISYGVAGDILQGQLAKLAPQQTMGSQATEGTMQAQVIQNRMNDFMGEWRRRLQEIRREGSGVLYDSTFSDHPDIPGAFDNDAKDEISNTWSSRFDA